MLALKFFLMILGLGLFGSAGIIVAYDVYVAARLRWLLEQSSGQGGAEGITLKPDRPFGPIRSKLAGALALAGILPVLLALSISVVPDGYAGIRVSQISGVHPATLYPGAHFQTPFIDTIVLYDTREQVYTTSAASGPKTTGEVLSVQAREGLNIGLAVSVRYRLDPTRLGSIHQNLPQPVGDQVVAPVVSSIYRQLAPNYETREIFAVKREELRTHAAMRSRPASQATASLFAKSSCATSNSRLSTPRVSKASSLRNRRTTVSAPSRKSNRRKSASPNSKPTRRKRAMSSGPKRKLRSASCRPRRKRTPCNTPCP